MSETFNPSVKTTFLPKTSGLVFGERLQARSAKGRIFLSGSGTTSLVVASGQAANWLNTNVYEVGQTIEGKTAAYTGGVEPVTYRYRFQTKPTGSSSWINGPWTNTTNAKNLVTYTLTETGQIKLQSQARDSSDPTVQLNSITGVKTVAPSPTPLAYGLRFDSARTTSLSRSLASDGTFTYSFWAKYTTNTINFTARSTQGYLGMLNGNVAYYDDGLGGFPIDAPYTLPLNEWTHWVLVVQPDSQELYINGQLAGSGTSPGTAAMFNALVNVGGYSSGNTQQAFNGYLSEVYFAEVALLPTAFGVTLSDGTWSNLDPDTIINNIDNAQVPETNQVWSDYVTSNDPNGFNFAALPPKAFDGNIDDYCDTDSPGRTITVTFPVGVAYTSKVEVFVRQKNVNAGINGGSQVEVNGDDTSFAWAAVATGSGTMNSLEVTATTNFCGFAGVRVDGVILVDQVSSPDNGFYLPFDPEAGIGADASGNGNNFQDQNFVLTGSDPDTLDGVALITTP